MPRIARALPLFVLLLLLAACGGRGATAVVGGALVAPASAVPTAGSAPGGPTGTVASAAGTPTATRGGVATAGTVPSGQIRAFALVANFDDDTIGVYAVGADGLPQPVAGSPFRTGPRPGGIALSADGRFVFVSAQGRDGAAGGIWAYALAANGALAALPGAPYAIGETPGPLAFDPAGKRLYIACSGRDEGIYAFTLDATSGALSRVAGSPFTQDGDRAAALAFSPNGRFLYFAQDDGRGLAAYRIDQASGAPSALQLTPAITTGNAYAVAINPAGTLLYAGFEGGIFGYRIEGDGTLTALASQAQVTGTHKALLFNPNGRILYAANYFTYTLTAYSLGDGGQLRANTGALTTAAYPTALALDRGATLLYATTEDKLINGGKVGDDGAALAALRGAPPPTGAHPAAIILTNEPRTTTP